MGYPRPLSMIGTVNSPLPFGRSYLGQQGQNSLPVRVIIHKATRKTQIVNKWVEGYLRNYVVGQQRTWIKWLHLGEYCYNTTYHMSIKMTPFKPLYGYEALNFADLAFGDSRAPKAKDWVQDNQDILKVLRENLQEAQNQQKLYADRHRIERRFEVGDLVYLRLQPYR